MRILITGSNGVVGKEIVNLLSKDKKYKLVLLTNKKIKKNKKKIKLYYQDLTKPINYKLSKQPMSQNLGGIFKHVPAIAIMSKDKIIKYRNVLSKNPYKMFLTKPESFDIDTMYDFKLAEMYYKNKNTNRLL